MGHKDESIAAFEGRAEHEVLNVVEVLRTRRVAFLRVGEERPFARDMSFPGVGLGFFHAEDFPVNTDLGPEADTYDIRAGRIYRAESERGVADHVARAGPESRQVGYGVAVGVPAPGVPLAGS